jgi:hypothetical protein
MGLESDGLSDLPTSTDYRRCCWSSRSSLSRPDSSPMWVTSVNW